MLWWILESVHSLAKGVDGNGKDKKNINDDYYSEAYEKK